MAASIGLGFRGKHFTDILSSRPNVPFFEGLTENYLRPGSQAQKNLQALAALYPITLHGVSLSIGSTDPLNFRYLKLLRELAAKVKAKHISDHVCWTGVAGRNFHDLLPLPYTEKSLYHVVARIKEVQDFLGQQISLENPSTYVAFKESSMPEWEWLAEMAELADCGILLDVNNVYVSAFNHGFDPDRYIEAIPAQRIHQIHVAGHTQKDGYILDSHVGPTPMAVIDLLAKTLAKTGSRPVIIEWDEEIPSLEGLVAEKERIEKQLNIALPGVAA
jgi:uncharacterized protein (UPF0276 family)